jgi:hypothetical protein
VPGEAPGLDELANGLPEVHALHYEEMAKAGVNAFAQRAVAQQRLRRFPATVTRQ